MAIPKIKIISEGGMEDQYILEIGPLKYDITDQIEYIIQTHSAEKVRDMDKIIDITGKYTKITGYNYPTASA